MQETIKKFKQKTIRNVLVLVVLDKKLLNVVITNLSQSWASITQEILNCKTILSKFLKIFKYKNK